MYKALFIAMIVMSLSACASNKQKKTQAEFEQAQAATLEEDKELGYQGKSEAESISNYLREIQQDPNFSVRESNGWIVATDESKKLVVLFTPNAHPANPSYIERQVVKEGDNAFLETKIVCSAEKVVCDQLATNLKLVEDGE